MHRTGYEEALFNARALSIIRQHPVSRPLYLYYALHTSCVGVKRPGDTGGVPGKPEALQAPAQFYDRLHFIDNEDRRKNHAMVRRGAVTVAQQTSQPTYASYAFPSLDFQACRVSRGCGIVFQASFLTVVLSGFCVVVPACRWAIWTWLSAISPVKLRHVACGNVPCWCVRAYAHHLSR